MTDKFAGFPNAGLRFLRELKANNDRDWFRERKDIYEQQVKRPMELLVMEAAAACRKRGLPVFAKDRNPVMRIYRDIRFRADKTPFNTHVSAGLKTTGAAPGYGELYIHISPAESFLAAGFWMPERPFLQAWRAAMIDNQTAALRMVKALEKNGLALSQEYRLRRLPRGFDQHAGGALAELLKLTSFVTSRKVDPKEFQSPAFVNQVVEFGIAAKPLLEFGWKLNYVPPRDVLDER